MAVQIREGEVKQPGIFISILGSLLNESGKLEHELFIRKGSEGTG